MYVMVAFYVLAGINHFVHTDVYVRIMPVFIPLKEDMVYASGICEIIFSLLLLWTKTRKIGAALLVVLLIAVFPANIQMAVTAYHTHSDKLWLALVRLPVQALLIYWAWSYRDLKKN